MCGTIQLINAICRQQTLLWYWSVA